MHSAASYNIELKISILKTLLGCLRDSHRTRTIFRKVGGFVYVTSVLVSLDGKLNENSDMCKEFTNSTKDEEITSDSNQQQKVKLDELLQLLNIICHCLVTAMRFEPANAKFFHHEICNTSLCDTLRLLGWFTSELNVLL
jgi:hypothetical protein